MKPSLAAAMAAMLSAVAGTPWAAHAQVLPSSGPGSSFPLSPDDRPLISRPYPSIALGLITAMPGPYLPNPNDPALPPSTHPGVAALQE
jgi:hypothetical protein